MVFAPPPAVFPSAFPVEKGGGDGIGGGADCLVLRRPSASWAGANDGGGGEGGAGGGEGPREEGAGAAAEAAVEAATATATSDSSQGRLGRMARWRGGGGGAAERRQAEAEGGVTRRPLELSPAMELLSMSLSGS